MFTNYIDESFNDKSSNLKENSKKNETNIVKRKPENWREWKKKVLFSFYEYYDLSKRQGKQNTFDWAKDYGFIAFMCMSLLIKKK